MVDTYPSAQTRMGHQESKQYILRARPEINTPGANQIKMEKPGAKYSDARAYLKQ